MAIDTMKRVTIVTQVASSQRLIKTLHDLSVMELIDAGERFGEADGRLRRQTASTEECDVHLQKIRFVRGLLDRFAPEKQSFFAGLTPLPLVTTPEELDRALAEVDLEALYATAQELDETYRRAERVRADAESELRELTPFEDVEADLGALARLKRLGLVFGYLTARGFAALTQNVEAGQVMSWDVAAAGEPMKLVFAFRKEDEDAARRLLNEVGFEETPLPPLTGSVKERMAKLREDRAEAESQMAAVEARVKEMAEQRRPLKVLEAFWDSNRGKALARTQALRGKWVHVLCGYVREKDMPKLESALAREFPDAALTVEDPSPDEDVPVSISLPRLVRPIQMLIDLFGRPVYGTFDPSPFLIFNFFLFFGLCFGDVFYGIMLITLSLYLRSKTREYPGVFNFGTLFLYAGISTTICGAALGSWFGDLWNPDYLGEGNVLQRLRNGLFLGLDPLEKPLPALGLALLIGMLNQFYGISLKVYGLARNRDWASAIFDGVLWLLVLPGLILTMAGLMTDVIPGVVTKIGLVMTVLGAVGLVLTQGRAEQAFMSKAITGVVSLYGILGSYGITAFVGDTLSYCRLLALGVTTSIVAMSVNIMANMLREIPYVGFVLFLMLLVLGHIFNFGINVLGAFIHSMRLIFVEFFGRFYEGGARPFRPLGFDTPDYVLKRPA